MKIAIHHSPISYSSKWITYCKDHHIPYKIVNCFDSDIITQIADCDVLMWHYHHKDSKEILLARQLLNAIESSGKIVYPNHETSWFFDDKVAQKYLLEVIGAPLIPSYTFYEKKDATKWIKEASFPIVFKLRRGAGSANVKLVWNKREALKLVRKAFSSGFRQYDPWNGMKERWRNYRLRQTTARDLIEGLGRFFIKTKFEKIVGREKGYIYFQDFIPDCLYDFRTTVIGDKCYALKRLVRMNDFRASGSHNEIHDPAEIPLDIVKISFKIAKRLGLQSVAFDFLITPDQKPVITELSHVFGWDEGDADAYWDSQLNLHRTPFNPFGEMIANIIS